MILATLALVVAGPSGPALEAEKSDEYRAEYRQAFNAERQRLKRCIRRARAAALTAHALDLGSTIYSIESGRGREVGLAALLGGKIEHVVAMKAASIAVIEWSTARSIRRGNYKAACQGQKISAVITGLVVVSNGLQLTGAVKF